MSALYITGDKANQNYAVLRPYFDFNAKLHNKQKLERNIKQRKLNIDLDEINLLWSTYVDVSRKKSVLEQKRKEIANAIRSVDPKADGSEALIRKFKIEGTMARTDLKTLKENGYALEDTFIHKFLDLPNDIHDRTPSLANEVYFNSDQHTVNDTENHLNKVNYLEYHDPFCYFLKSDAAKCDLKMPLYCMDMFRSFGCIPFSNPDFIRSILAEGAGVNVNDLLTIVEEDLENKLNLLHLAGSGSMLSFLGFVTKLLVYKNCLPLKFVSNGKTFSVRNTTSATDYGLYSACQTTNVQLFGVTANATESLHQFDETLEQMIQFYKTLDSTFRVSYVTGDQLTQSEELRAVFEMYSTHRKCFVPVGHLNSYGDYISKRLLFALKDDKVKQFQFPHLISGNVINVTKYLAILLEEKGGVLRTPSVLEHF